MKKKVPMGLIIGIIALVVIVIIIIAYFIGVSYRKTTSMPQEKELPDNINEINLIAEGLLQALNDDDYSFFSEDFSEEMKIAMDKSKFEETKQLLDETSGKYISKETPTRYEYQGYEMYRYICSFEKEQVTVTLYLSPDSKLVEGLWFDSANLKTVFQQ